MSIFLWPFLLVLDLAAFILAPILVTVTLPFWAWRRTVNPLMPPWLAWLNTPDDPTGAQGTYEPAVRAIEANFGWTVKTIYWLGVRNTFGGMWKALARPGPELGEWPVYGFVQTKGPYRAGVWLGWSASAWEFDAVWPWTSTKCGNIRLGWRVHDGSGTFLFQIRPWITRDSTT